LLAPLLLCGEATAAPGHCHLEVDGRVYLNGPCNVIVQPGGSFTIGVDEKQRSPYFAYVAFEHGGPAQGFWNEDAKSNHAHTPLGELKRSGACWVNQRAKVCAWRR
jgi:hypothetical protein